MCTLDRVQYSVQQWSMIHCLHSSFPLCWARSLPRRPLQSINPVQYWLYCTWVSNYSVLVLYSSSRGCSTDASPLGRWWGMKCLARIPNGLIIHPSIHPSSQSLDPLLDKCRLARRYRCDWGSVSACVIQSNSRSHLVCLEFCSSWMKGRSSLARWLVWDRWQTTYLTWRIMAKWVLVQ